MCYSILFLGVILAVVRYDLSKLETAPIYNFLTILSEIFRIDDFEFTPECAIYDLLDIPLYHGWIVDPQVWFVSLSDWLNLR